MLHTFQQIGLLGYQFWFNTQWNCIKITYIKAHDK